jgi:small acid-soluble spore protein I (minor)
MEASIRHFIKQNFKNATCEELQIAINDAIKTGDEVSLPGLGVLFEVLWQNSDDSFKANASKTISNFLK